MAKRANGEGTVCKRSDGIWMAAVTVGRDHSTGKAVRKYVYGKTRSEVLEKKAALLEKSKGLAYLDADKVTVKQWLENWLQVYARNAVRKNTMESYDYIVSNYLIPALGSIRLAKLQGIQIQDMVNGIRDRGGSPRLAEYVFAILRRSVRQALKEQIIDRDPTLAVTLPKKQKKKITPLTDDQWTALLTTAATPTYISLYAALLLEWGTGMRRSELVALRWQDVDLQRGLVMICRSAMATKEGPQIAAPKSEKSRRTIPLSPSVLAELKKHKARQSAKRLQATVWNDNDLVFPTRTGDLQDPRVFSRRFSRLVKAAGLTGVSFHMLRHDHASRLFAQGEHPRDVQDRLGHSTITLTMDTYTHAMPGRQEKISQRLEKSLPPLPATDQKPQQKKRQKSDQSIPTSELTLQQ